MKNIRWRLAAAVAALGCAAAPAFSQSYPAKPVRIIVGFAPSGVVDTPTRIVATRLGEAWGQSLVIENRPGAGGSTAAGVAAKAPADGYTLLACNTASHGVNPAIYKQLAYDPVKDYAAVSLIGFVPNVLLVHPSVEAKTLRELIAYAKANPGKLSMASAGVGTSQHMSIELLKSMTGTEITHIPYKGGAPALSDLLGGQIPSLLTGLPAGLGAARSGRARALGVTTAGRSQHLPDVPAISEVVPGYEVSSWVGICAPAGVPRAIVAKLNEDIVKVLGLPETKQKLAEQGVEAAPNTPEQFTAFIAAEIAKWGKVARSAGITPE
jgi:tripartite-type tricarboxylate transporter receptor subunit TctC